MSPGTRLAVAEGVEEDGAAEGEYHLLAGVLAVAPALGEASRHRALLARHFLY